MKFNRNSCKDDILLRVLEIEREWEDCDIKEKHMVISALCDVLLEVFEIDYSFYFDRVE